MKIAIAIISKGRPKMACNTAEIYTAFKGAKIFLFVDEKEKEKYFSFCNKKIITKKATIVPFKNISNSVAVNFAMNFLKNKFKHVLLSDDDIKGIYLYDLFAQKNRKQNKKETNDFLRSAYFFHKTFSSPATGFLQRGYDTRLIKEKNEFYANKKMGGAIIFDTNIFEKMGGYDEKLKIYSDTDYLLRLQKKGFETFQYIGKEKGYFSFFPMGTKGGLFETYVHENKSKKSAKKISEKHSSDFIQIKKSRTAGTITTKVFWKKSFFSDALFFLKSCKKIVFVEPHYDDVLLSCYGFFPILNELKIPWKVVTMVDNKYNSFSNKKSYEKFGAKKHVKLMLEGINLFDFSKEEKEKIINENCENIVNFFLNNSKVSVSKIRKKMKKFKNEVLIIPKGIYHPDHIATRKILEKMSNYYYIEMPYSFSIDKKPQAIARVSKKELTLAMNDFNKKDTYSLMIRYPEWVNQAIIKM